MKTDKMKDERLVSSAPTWAAAAGMTAGRHRRRAAAWRRAGAATQRGLLDRLLPLLQVRCLGDHRDRVDEQVLDLDVGQVAADDAPTLDAAPGNGGPADHRRVEVVGEAGRSSTKERSARLVVRTRMRCRTGTRWIADSNAAGKVRW